MQDLHRTLLLEQADEAAMFSEFARIQADALRIEQVATASNADGPLWENLESLNLDEIDALRNLIAEANLRRVLRHS